MSDEEIFAFFSLASTVRLDKIPIMSLTALFGNGRLDNLDNFLSCLSCQLMKNYWLACLTETNYLTISACIPSYLLMFGLESNVMWIVKLNSHVPFKRSLAPTGRLCIQTLWDFMTIPKTESLLDAIISRFGVWESVRQNH